jgi:hypothetical protein
MLASLGALRANATDVPAAVDRVRASLGTVVTLIEEAPVEDADPLYATYSRIRHVETVLGAADREAQGVLQDYQNFLARGVHYAATDSAVALPGNGQATVYWVASQSGGPYEVSYGGSSTPPLQVQGTHCTIPNLTNNALYNITIKDSTSTLYATAQVTPSATGAGSGAVAAVTALINNMNNVKSPSASDLIERLDLAFSVFQALAKASLPRTVAQDLAAPCQALSDLWRHAIAGLEAQLKHKPPANDRDRQKLARQVITMHDKLVQLYGLLARQLEPQAV